MITNNTMFTLTGLLISIVLVGCTAYPTTEDDFGESVRHLIRTQKVYTGPPDASPVEGGDGDRLNNVLEVYRTDVSAPEEVQQPLVISVGN